ncbi:hypothetical protein BGX38DRAFT_1212613 [Terfezia claveryi]|nr:hypothetical protein BGX38DRAFT_1212613 [Terfezia claveryi]
MASIVRGRVLLSQALKVWPPGIPKPSKEAVVRLGIPMPVRRVTSVDLLGTLATRIKAARGKMVMIRNMAREAGWHDKILVEVLVAVVLPTFCYGCEVWKGEGLMGKVDGEWFRMVKMGLQWKGPIARRAIFKALGIPSVREFRLHLRRRLIIRTAKTPGHLCETGGPELIIALREWLEDPIVIDLWRVRPMETKWELRNDELLDSLDRADSDTWKSRVQSIVDFAITEEDRSVFYTDGSVMEDGKAGAGFIRACGGEVFSEPRSFLLGKGLVVGDAEVEAVAQAVGASEGKKGPMPDSVISLRGQGKDPQVMWIPGHIGIVGNEKADEAAKKGAMFTEHPNRLMITMAAAKAIDSEMWRASKVDKEWG